MRLKIFSIVLVCSLINSFVFARSRVYVEIKPVAESNVSGILEFVQTGNTIKITGKLFNLSQGLHGFHIHDVGDCSGSAAENASGHFNPKSHEHGSPDSIKRHVGDLGNIEADEEGIAIINIIDKKISFKGTNSIIGKSVIVHEDADDFKSQPSGNAGARIACGVITYNDI